MGVILDFINDNNDGRFQCYKTKKFSINDLPSDSIISENSDTTTVPLDKSGEFAETNVIRRDYVEIPKRLIENDVEPLFCYFLDGSRHVYKVDEIEIGDKIFPIIAGQIIVGCCHRIDRDTFKKERIIQKNVIALPVLFRTKGKVDDFARDYCQKINNELAKNPRYSASFSDILFYKIDGETVGKNTDKDRYTNSGIARIQNAMTDCEQLMVSELCKELKLDDEHMLIKDGSIQYNPSYSYIERTQWNLMRSNYQNVVGVSKSFNPSLLKNFESKKMAPIIANLPPLCRTKAYKYQSKQNNGSWFAIWYVRLRKENGFRETRFSDVVKCEYMMNSDTTPISSDLIDYISANLIREAYPVCYGSDSRWGNHIYPVFLTESFCKSHYINDNTFLSLF